MSAFIHKNYVFILLLVFLCNSNVHTMSGNEGTILNRDVRRVLIGLVLGAVGCVGFWYYNTTKNNEIEAISKNQILLIQDSQWLKENQPALQPEPASQSVSTLQSELIFQPQLPLSLGRSLALKPFLQQALFLKPVKPGCVRIYHSIGRGGTLESVRKNGLLTARELYSRGLSNFDPSSIRGLFPDHFDIVYFTWNAWGGNLSENSVGMDVDPNDISVRNREYRFHHEDVTFEQTRNLYQQSAMSLTQFMGKVERAKNMRTSGIYAELDAITAEPIDVRNPETKWQVRRAEKHPYWNEITIPSCIPPDQLVFPEVVVSPEVVD